MIALLGLLALAEEPPAEPLPTTTPASMVTARAAIVTYTGTMIAAPALVAGERWPGDTRLTVPFTYMSGAAAIAALVPVFRHGPKHLATDFGPTRWSVGIAGGIGGRHPHQTPYQDVMWRREFTVSFKARPWLQLTALYSGDTETGWGQYMDRDTSGIAASLVWRGERGEVRVGAGPTWNIVSGPNTGWRTRDTGPGAELRTSVTWRVGRSYSFGLRWVSRAVAPTTITLGRVWWHSGSDAMLMSEVHF